MNFLNKTSVYNLGRVLCIFGFFAFSWDCAKWVTEESRLATVSNCVQFTEDDGVFPFGSSKTIPMIRCIAEFSADGSNNNTVLTSRTPQNFDANRLERKAVLITSRLSPQYARFASHPRDWSNGVNATLALCFSGFVCINLGKKFT
jgi:hypothetical protein